MVVLRTAPNAPIQFVFATKVNGARYGSTLVERHDQYDSLTHATADFLEKPQGQGRDAEFSFKDRAVETINRLPQLIIHLVTMKDLQGDTLLLDTPTLPTHFFAFARGEGFQKMIEVVVAAIAPVILATKA